MDICTTTLISFTGTRISMIFHSDVMTMQINGKARMIRSVLMQDKLVGFHRERQHGVIGQELFNQIFITEAVE